MNVYDPGEKTIASNAIFLSDTVIECKLVSINSEVASAWSMEQSEEDKIGWKKQCNAIILSVVLIF